MKGFEGIWLPKKVVFDVKLSDKEKHIYSMIIALSKENEFTMSNAYIGNLLNISTVQVSRLVNSLKKKGYIKTEMIYKENSKEIAIRKCIPINKYDNTYNQKSALPINKNVKDIKYNNNINNINNWRYKSDRDYSDFNLEKLYANNV